MKEMSLYDFYQKTKNDNGGDNILMNAIIHNQMMQTESNTSKAETNKSIPGAAP